MAWAPDYCTSDELKHYATITNNTSDAEIGFAISAASRAIDTYCERQFGVLSAAAPRYFESYYNRRQGRYITVIEDLMSTTGLVVKTNDQDGGSYSNTLVLNTDFVLRPINAVADGRPWTMIEGVSGSSFSLPARAGAIEITAKWGWTDVPALVKQACLMQANRLLKRKGAPFGVAGSPESGSEVRLLAKLDADAQMLLSGLVRPWGVV
jgi:hypothetical protein